MACMYNVHGDRYCDTWKKVDIFFIMYLKYILNWLYNKMHEIPLVSKWNYSVTFLICLLLYLILIYDLKGVFLAWYCWWYIFQVTKEKCNTNLIQNQNKQPCSLLVQLITHSLTLTQAEYWVIASIFSIVNFLPKMN